MDAQKLGLRERKKLRTRRELEAVALRLFTERGFDATTVEQIAERVEVTQRTFYRYFPTKEDVVLATFAERLARLEELLERGHPEQGPIGALREAFLEVARGFEEDRNGSLLRARLIATTPALNARFLQLQARGEATVARVVAGWLRVETDDVRPRLIAATAVGAMRAGLGAWVAGDAAGSLSALVGQAFDLVERGSDDVLARRPGRVRS